MEGVLPRGGTPPLVPMWPGVCVLERNPFPFFPFNPRWRHGLNTAEFQVFSVLLRLAWISPRPCMLPPQLDELERLAATHISGAIPARALQRFRRDERLGFLIFPPQLRALQRLVSGEDLYALLWDESL
jgi:hypothetical protein